jgi:hypothetical protein
VLEFSVFPWGDAPLAPYNIDAFVAGERRLQAVCFGSLSAGT